MSKIKVLALTADTDGVGYYRIINPHSYLSDPDVEVDVRLLMDGTMNLADESFTSQYKIIIYNKNLSFPNQEYANMFVEIVNKYRIRIIFDIDDYWILNPTHLNYNSWKQSNAGQMVENIIRASFAVTTTTPLFAERIKELNPRVFVLENSLNKDEYQWRYENKIPSDKIRFLWGGGISHMPDLRLLKRSFEMFDKDFLKECQLYMCGYDLRIRTPKGIMIGDPKTNQWSFFESIFTNNGKWITNSKYRDYLKTYDSKNYGINEEFRNEFYQRRWTKPILWYGTMYQESDVVLSPLKNNSMFNYYKSQLKVIEAGIYKCPIIASNYGPYTIDIEDGKDGFLIDESKPSMWYEKMKWFSKNPNAVKDMGENLHRKVLERYEMSVVNKKRSDIYKLLSVEPNEIL